MPAGVGTFYPAGLTSPNAWDTLDFTSATNLSGIPDMTAAVQAAIDAASASGYGGDVILPAGVIRINGVTLNSGGVNLIGQGWEEYTSPSGKALRGKRGTYILTDNPANPTITVGPGAFSCRIDGVAFLQPQPADGSQWAPTVFKPSILIAGGSTRCTDLLFWGCYTGIQIGDPVTPVAASQTLLRDIYGACFNRLVDVRYATASLVLDNINHLPGTFLAGNGGQLQYILNNAMGIWLGPSVKPILKNLNLANSLVGLFIGFNNSIPGNPGNVQSPQRPHIAGADFDQNIVGVFCLAQTIQGGLRMTDFSVSGAQQAVGSLTGPPSVQRHGDIVRRHRRRLHRIWWWWRGNRQHPGGDRHLERSRCGKQRAAVDAQ
jgi:hypothetical protein